MSHSGRTPSLPQLLDKHTVDVVRHVNLIAEGRGNNVGHFEIGAGTTTIVENNLFESTMVPVFTALTENAPVIWVVSGHKGRLPWGMPGAAVEHSRISTSGSFLRCWTKKDIDEVWPQVEWRIEDVTNRTGDYGAADIRQRVMDGRAQLWTADKQDDITAITVTTVQIYPKRKTVTIWLAHGDNLDFLEFLPILEEWAEDIGAAGVAVIGRRGWKKLLVGYDEQETTFFKRVG